MDTIGEILYHLRVRRHEKLTSERVGECIDRTAQRLSVKRENVLEWLIDILFVNYTMVCPSIWFGPFSDSISSRKDVSRHELLTAYIYDCTRLAGNNMQIPPTSNRSVRLCTYNVHYWTDAHGSQLNFKNILGVISSIDPHILCLQEALLPFHDGLVPSKVHYDGYEDQFQINSEIELQKITDRSVKTKLDWNIDDIYSHFEQNGYRYRSACMGSTIHCRVGTYFGNAIFSKIPITDALGLTLPPNVEGRCMSTCGINIGGKNTLVCSIHLDVFDETGSIRKKQLEVAVSYIDYITGSVDLPLPVIVMGDFNCLLSSDYNREEVEWLQRNNRNQPLDFSSLSVLTDAGFDDVFGVLKYTVWSARRTDYVFTRGITRDKIVGTYVYFTPASDHLPLIIDIANY